MNKFSPYLGIAPVTVWQQAMFLAEGVAEQALAERRAVVEAERLRVAAVEEARQLKARPGSRRAPRRQRSAPPRLV